MTKNMEAIREMQYNERKTAAGIQLGPSFDLDPWVEEALSARCCLPIVAALLHVPKLQALHQKQVATPMPGQTPEHIQV